MAQPTYSGALLRAAGAHFSSRPPVPGVNPEHTQPDPDPDPFSPQVEAQPAPGDVWQPDDLPRHTEMVVRDRPHWAYLEAPVPTNVPREVAGLATTARMLENHGRVDFRPDQYAPYKHASQGRTIEFCPGRMPQVAGESTGPGTEYLMMGRNGYDVTNQPNEVYQGDAANVGRYRLGMRIEDFGLYEFHTQQGQDAWLRAYSGLEPMFPTDKPRVPDSAPYTPNSSGTTTWTLNQWQLPSFFSLPSETSMTDQMVADESADPGFSDGGRM